MILFYIGAAALVLAGLIFALWPLIKSAFTKTALSAERVERKAINIALYADHLKELEQSRSQGNIDQAQFDQLKQELERNLLEDSVSDEQALEVKGATKRSVYYVIAVVIVLPALVFGFYQQLGYKQGWQLKAQLEQQLELQQKLANAPTSKTIAKELDQLNRQLVTGLESYLADKPDDLDSKVLLARNAVAVEDYDKAIEVYQQILEKEPQAAQMMAELAQTLFVKANNRAIPVVAILAERAVAIQPQNVMALSLLGIAAFQNENYQKAINHWQTAVAIYPPNSANGRALQSGIAQARARLAAQPESERETAQQDSEESQKPAIKVAVSLGAAVPVESSHTVFIYARAWQGARVPLAITRITADQLPLTIELNDSMSMAPGMNLSSAEQVEVIARLSPSGNAIAQAGDWQVSIGPVSPKSVSSTVYPLVIAQPLAEN